MEVKHTWLWLPALFFLVLAGWALTSPTGSSPDDDFHLTSIWCSDGEQPGRCVFLADDTRSVPAAVVDAASCYAFKPEVSAGCVTGLPDAFVVTDRANDVQNLYPTLFYRAMSLLVGPDVERSVLVMRLMNALIASVLLGFALRLAPVAVRSAVIVTVVVGYLPLGLSLIPSTNPSSWAITGIMMLAVFGLTLLHRTDWRSPVTWLVGALTVFSAVLAIGSRVDAMAYAVITAIVILIYSGWRQARLVWPAVVILAFICLGAITSYLTFGTPGGAEPMGEQPQTAGLFTTNLLYLPALVQGVVGGWSLGWNDTAMPPLVPIVGILVLGALTYRGLSDVRARRGLAILVSAAMVFAIPLTFLQREGLGVGEVVQPRYILPLVLLTVLMLTLGNTVEDPLPISASVATVLWISLSTSAVLAFWAYAHRYVIGADYPLVVVDLPIEWSSSSGIPFGWTVLITAFASIAFIGGGLTAVHRLASFARHVSEKN